MIRKQGTATIESSAHLAIEEQSFDQGDVLRDEIAAFLKSVRERTLPRVFGAHGLRACETAAQTGILVRSQ